MSELRDRNGLTEEEYLKSYDPDKWKKPSLTADICIISNKDSEKRYSLSREEIIPVLANGPFPEASLRKVNV